MSATTIARKIATAAVAAALSATCVIAAVGPVGTTAAPTRHSVIVA
ncbi:hypothetical protein ACFSGX_02760 [Sphingomonas arantia]|uniref:Uncharacterized protein n=1 Tax=Sphingomonas arantia TaxID=1460676 RepID=A0ABW4TWT2_9SPHN